MKLWFACLVAGGSGFVALSYEILWYRLFAFASAGRPTTFGLLLGFYLLGIALGSFGMGIFCGRRGRTRSEDLRTRDVLVIALFSANAVAFAVAPATGWIAETGRWRLGYVLVFLATVLLGAILPLVSHLAIDPDDRAGSRLSYLYLANILGSSLGSLLTGFVVADFASTRQIAVGVALLGLALLAVVTFPVREKTADPGAARRRRGTFVVWTAFFATFGTLVVSSAHGAFDQIYERLLYLQDFTPSSRFAETVENKSGVIEVTADGKVWGGGAYDGALNTSLVHDKNLIYRAYAVSELHPRPARVLMIGLSSGSWAAVLASAPGLEHLTVVEINPGYLAVIARHPEVSFILRDPKVDIEIDDGRRWLSANPDRTFDAIVMNTTWHWRANSTNLLSREFVAVVKTHLRRGGIFYFNTTSSKDACVTTLAAFDHVYRVNSFLAGSEAPLGIDAASFKSLLESYRVNGLPVLDLANAEDQRAEAEVLRLTSPSTDGSQVEDGASLRTTCASGRIITDDNMAPEWEGRFAMGSWR